MYDAQLFKSVDTKKFKKLVGNRNISKRNVKNILKSIKENGLFPTSHIVVNENNEVIDGQNRLAAIELYNKETGGKLEFSCELWVGAGLAEAKKLNAGGRENWRGESYLQSEIELGNRDYQDLKLFLERYPFINQANAITLLSGRATHGKKEAQEFKDGLFKITTTGLSLAEKTAKRLAILQPYVEINVINHRDFFPAVMSFFDEVERHKGNDAEILEKLNDYLVRNGKVKRQLRIRDYYYELRDAYNFRRQNDERKIPNWQGE